MKKCIHKEGIISDKIDKILFWIIAIITLIFIILGIFVYWQSHRIMSMFSSNAEEKSQVDKVLTGKIVTIKDNLITIQVNDKENPNVEIEKEIIINEDTKIYQDSNPDETNKIKTEKVDKTAFKIGDSIVIGLTRSNTDIPLIAEVIHILP